MKKYKGEMKTLGALALTILIFALLYNICFVRPANQIEDIIITKNGIEKSVSDDLKVNGSIAKMGFKSVSPISYPIPITELGPDVTKFKEYRKIADQLNVTELRRSDILNAYDPSLNRKYRFGIGLFGWIQFFMIWFLLALILNYWSGLGGHGSAINIDSKSFKKINREIADIKESRRKKKFDIKPGFSIKKVKLKDNAYESDIKEDMETIVSDFAKTGKSPAIQKLENTLERYELDHENNLRWLEWGLFIIPTIGFIGTVVGISSALGYTENIFTDGANKAIPEIASKLSLAFDTTFLALISTVLLFTIKNDLDNKFFKNFLHPFSDFMYTWIAYSEEVDLVNDLNEATDKARKVRIALDVFLSNLKETLNNI